MVGHQKAGNGHTTAGVVTESTRLCQKEETGGDRGRGALLYKEPLRNTADLWVMKETLDCARKGCIACIYKWVLLHLTAPSQNECLSDFYLRAQDHCEDSTS